MVIRLYGNALAREFHPASPFQLSFHFTACVRLLSRRPLDIESCRCYDISKLNIGNRSWKLGVNPAQGRCCNSLKLSGKCHWSNPGRRPKRASPWGTQAISQNTCLVPCRMQCGVFSSARLRSNGYWRMTEFGNSPLFIVCHARSQSWMRTGFVLSAHARFPRGRWQINKMEENQR